MRKIKMLEYFQGSGQPTLEIGKEYEVKEIGAKLADWLLEHRKAEEIEQPKPKPKPAPKKQQPETKSRQEPVKRARKPRGRAKK